MKVSYEKFNPNWSVQFQELKNGIEPLVSKYIKNILHVGSTSIKGMSAKPIIDIDMVVEDFANLDEIKQALSIIGYEHRGNQGIEDREAFICSESKIYHHLYLIKEDSIAFRNHIFLKRHLENNTDSFIKYESLKSGLSKSTKNREDYWRSKTEFILSCLEKEGMNESELAIVRSENL
jgi:GrpB-like predicted nucleotidyltransferase (UPF0157 family)